MRKMWFIISIIVQGGMFLYGCFYDRIYGFLVVGMPADYKTKILVLHFVGILGGLFLLLYYIYRLFFLYRGTKARAQWTIVHFVFLGVIALAVYDRMFPLLSPFLTVHLLIPYAVFLLGALCVWHDSEVLSGA